MFPGVFRDDITKKRADETIGPPGVLISDAVVNIAGGEGAALDGGKLRYSDELIAHGLQAVDGEFGVD